MLDYMENPKASEGVVPEFVGVAYITSPFLPRASFSRGYGNSRKHLPALEGGHSFSFASSSWHVNLGSRGCFLKRCHLAVLTRNACPLQMAGCCKVCLLRNPHVDLRFQQILTIRSVSREVTLRFVLRWQMKQNVPTMDL